MVEILPNGQPRVRFIDPSAPAMALINTPQFDIGIFNWGMSNLEKKFPLPY
jgi:hypothetical protein